MTIWNLFEYAAWALSALIAAWMLYDANAITRRYGEEFLTHTIEDLGDADFSHFDGTDTEGAR